MPFQETKIECQCEGRIELELEIWTSKVYVFSRARRSVPFSEQMNKGY